MGKEVDEAHHQHLSLLVPVVPNRVLVWRLSLRKAVDRSVLHVHGGRRAPS